MGDKTTCDEHRACITKISQTCIEMAGIRERVKRNEEVIDVLNETIFGLGGKETIKSRLQQAEDGVNTLKDMVLENRVAVKESLDSLSRGIIKFVVIMISIATIVIGGMFGLLWTEIKSVQITQIEVSR